MAHQSLKSQNLSIMMTDIQGYSDTSSTSSREDIVKLIRRHNQLMVPVITFYGGKVIKSVGDAFLCTFQSATDAVVCAIIIQLMLKEYNQRQADTSRRMNLRVVINTGDVSLEDNDIYGDAVNVTSRIEGLECFTGGSIGISEATYLLMNRSEIVAEKIGPQKLRGIPEPVTVYRVPLEKQRMTSLPARLMTLVEQAVSADPVGPVTAIATPGAPATATKESMTEWANSITSFLKDQNWGENIGQIGQNIGNLQKSLVTTFSQKSVVESKGGAAAAMRDASVPSRLKSFAVDAVILFVVWLCINFSWFFVLRGSFIAPDTLSSEEYSHYLASRPIPGSVTGHVHVQQWEVGPDGRYIRPRGFFESLVVWFADTSMRLPVVVFIAYFFIFWKLRGATPGQIAGATAVVSETGGDLTVAHAAKRAVLFVISCCLLGLGAVTILTAERRALYDKLSQTRVVE